MIEQSNFINSSCGFVGQNSRQFVTALIHVKKFFAGPNSLLYLDMLSIFIIQKQTVSYEIFNLLMGDGVDKNNIFSIKKAALKIMYPFQ